MKTLLIALALVVCVLPSFVEASNRSNVRLVRVGNDHCNHDDDDIQLQAVRVRRVNVNRRRNNVVVVRDSGRARRNVQFGLINIGR